MSQNPINLALRFILELCALAAMAYWGTKQAAPPYGWAIAGLVVLTAAAVWGTFRVPGDPGKAPVAVNGKIRLLIEFCFFGFASWGLFDAGASQTGWIFLVVTTLHYALSYDRVFRFLGISRE